MKQPLVLLHGLFGGLSNWNDVIAHFGERYDIHVPHLPIYDEHKQDILDYLVASLHDYVVANNLKDMVLVGNSLGGHVGILYAHRYAANVKSMLLTGSSGLYENNTLGSFPKRHSRTYIQERVEYTFYDAKTATPALVDEVSAIVRDNRKCFRIVKTAKTAQRNYVTKELPEISMPVLLIWGADDKITPPAVAEEFEKMLPNVKLVYLKECGHAPMMERPEEFNALMEKFLESGL